MKLNLKCFLFFTSFVIASGAISQNIGINSTGVNADPSAALDVVSTNKGLLIPRVALTALNSPLPITSPLTSLLVYNTANAGVIPNNVVPGYYYWDGAKWVSIAGASSGGLNWNILGNSGTNASNNFLGTIDAQDLVFRTNNTEKMRILSNGNVGINSSTPASKIDIVGDVNARTGYAATDYGVIMEGNTGGYGSLRAYQAGVGPANLILNPISGNIGIGTTAPNIKIHAEENINGDVGIRLWNPNSTGVNARELVIVGQASGGKYGYLAHHNDGYVNGFYPNLSPNSTMLSAGVGDLLLSAGTTTNDVFIGANGMNSQHVTIKGNTGYVGIGTTAPTMNIHAEENINGDVGLMLWNPNNTGVSARELIIFGQGSGGKYGFLAHHNDGYLNGTFPNLSPNSTMLCAGVGDLLLSAGTATNDVFIGTSWMNLQHVTIKGNTGNVGFGTTSPNLSLASSNFRVLTLKGNTSATGGIFEFSNNANSTTSGNDIGIINFFNGAQNIAGIASKTSGTDSGVLTFSTSPVGGPIKERMRIIENGHVGIGISSPTSALHVYEASGFAGTILPLRSALTVEVPVQSSNGYSIIKGTGGTTYGPGTVYGLELDLNPSGSSVGTTYGLYLKNETKNYISGDLGIGTTIPNERLVVQGNARLLGGSSLILNNPTNTSAASIDFNGSDALLFKGSASVERMRIDNVGRVGIGTTSPAYELDVNGGIRANQNSTGGILGHINVAGKNSAALEPNQRQWTIYNMNEYSGLKGLVFWEYYDGNGNGNFCDDGGNNCDPRMVIQNGTGNIGINAFNPSYKLEVGGTTACTGNVWTSDVRKKKDIQTLNLNALEVINKLRPVTFQWKDVQDNGMKGTQIGFIAQEIETLLPTTVVTGTDSDKSKGVKYNELLPVLVKALQEQQQIIEEMQKRIDKLEQK